MTDRVKGDRICGQKKVIVGGPVATWFDDIVKFAGCRWMRLVQSGCVQWTAGMYTLRSHYEGKREARGLLLPPRSCARGGWHKLSEAYTQQWVKFHGENYKSETIFFLYVRVFRIHLTLQLYSR